MTPSTRTGTLSRVMTSLMGMSRVSSRVSTKRTESITGKISIIPGPLSPWNFPRRSTTARSHCAAMRTMAAQIEGHQERAHHPDGEGDACAGQACRPSPNSTESAVPAAQSDQEDDDPGARGRVRRCSATGRA